MEKLYGIVMGQCTESLKSEIKGEGNYEDAEMDSNALWLLQTIKKISAGISTKKNETPGKSLDTFQKRFRLAVQTLELVGDIKVFLLMLKTIGVLNYTEADAISDEDKADEKKK
eukprot:4727648-Ditylum_brightwellii.AAC.1